MNLATLLAVVSAEQLTARGMDIAIKCTLLLAVAFLAHAVLRRRYTLVCSAMWNACLVALILLPAAVLMVPAIEIPAPWLASHASQLESPQVSLVDQAQSVTAPTPSQPAAEDGHREFAGDRPAFTPVATVQATDSSSSRIPNPTAASATSDQLDDDLASRSGGVWRTWLVTTYAVGVAFFALRLLLNLLAVRRLRASSTAIDDKTWTDRVAHWSAALAVRGRVSLGASEAVAVPVVIGAFRPAIILPETLVSQLTGYRRDAVLVHELAHVRRGDYAWHLLLSVVQAIYWPQPLVWLAGRCIARLRERACDDVCIHALGGRDEYRATLLDLARALVRPRALSLGMAAVRSSKIASRVAAIDRSSGNQHCLARRATRWSLALLLAALAILVGVAHPTAANSAADEPETRSTPGNGKAQTTEQSGKATQPADKSDTLIVTVVDDSGKPMAGLEVQAFRSWDSGPFKPEKTFTTDQQGRLVVPRQLTEDENGLQLIARDKENRLGYINLHPRWLTGDQALGRDSFELRLLPLERTIRGKLADQTGRPVAGAAVGVRSLSQRGPKNRYVDWYGPPATNPIGRAASQVNGTFEIRMPQFSSCAVSVAHQGFIAVYKNYRVGEDDVGTIKLRPGAIIAGRAVRAVTGKPVPGARIFASDQLDDRDEPSTGEIRYGSAYTDADGRYEIGNLKPGVYHIVLFSVEDQPQLTAVAHERLPIEGGSTTTADFDVIDGRLLAGRVVDVDDGAPIKGIEVAVNSPAYPRSSRGGHHGAKTDADGNIRFYLPPGECHVQINEGEIGGLADSKRSVFLEAETPLEPIVLRGRSREKEQEQSKFRISGSGYATTSYAEDTKKAADTSPKQREITIRFRTSDDKPVGTSVTEIWSRGGGPNMMMAHSGSEFSFPERYLGGFQPQEVPNTGEGRTSYLVIDAHGYARPEPVAVRAGQDETSITVDLKPPTVVPIRGRVVDGQGDPIAGANVATWSHILGQRSREPWGAQYLTDKQGRFEIKHTYVGNHISFHVTKPGWSGAITEPRPLADAGPIELGDLLMTEPNGMIAGRVVDISDQPLPGLVVAEQKHKIQTRTDAQGRFRLTSLPVGEASVAVVGSEYESYPRDVAVGTTDMLIKVYPKSPERRPDVPMIRGKFQTSDGKPITAASEHWWIDIVGEPTLWMSANRDGDSFEFSNVWPHALAKGKPQRLVIEVAGYKRPEPLEVATNKELNLVIKLEPAARVPVAGRVLDTDGKPLEGTTVWTTLKIGGSLHSDAWGPAAQTDANGRFSLDHIKDGDDITVHVGKPGFAGTTHRRTAQAGTQIDLGDVRLPVAKAKLSGVVVNRAKKPVAGARVYSNYLGRTFESTTDSAGRFTLAGLPDGKVILTVEADDFRAQHRADSNSKDITIAEHPR